jgi:hypothetical protein
LQKLLIIISFQTAEEINKNNNSNNERNGTAAKLLLSQSFKNPFPTLKLNSVSSKEVENIIRSMKTKKSHGYDAISNKILQISSPLTHIYIYIA